ncbi:lactonase family protein [Formicincola oecophyllae]|uniref:Lactonase family protein n=1 Tax=Formicincola oecophyllae TaxID=2558361 RepID=A0A4Y6U9W7_9PROT|nr:lactonase family protein [Formicincola oecophyllae]QDH12945.1 lactonase family protein [Formicincola oecophyllae]
MSTTVTRRHFALGAAALGAAATLSAQPAHASVENMEDTNVEPTGPGRIICYVGGYTKHGPPGVDGYGLGIASFQMDRSTGALTPLDTFTDIDSPSFIVLSKNQRHLYALSEIDDFNKEGDGCVTAFAVDPRTGALTKQDVVSSGGAVPAFISIHPSGKYVLCANYVGGSVSVLPIKADGSLGEATDVVRITGPKMPERAADNPVGNFAVSDHSGSHPHMIAATPDGQFVLADDAGLDRVYVWRLDLKTGKLIPAAVPFYQMLPGSAPRHFVFNKQGTLLYNLCEQDSHVVVSKFNPKTGAMTVMQRVIALPPYFKGSSLAAEILISEDDKHVYVSNRLGDSIAVFGVNPDGTLTLQDELWTHADYGRAMEFDPTRNFLFVANQRSDTVTSFRHNKRDGQLKFTKLYTPVGTPTTLAFLITQP